MRRLMARQKYLFGLIFLFFFFCQCYIVVIVESYKVKLATVDLSFVFSDVFYNASAQSLPFTLLLRLLPDMRLFTVRTYYNERAFMFMFIISL